MVVRPLHTWPDCWELLQRRQALFADRSRVDEDGVTLSDTTDVQVFVDEFICLILCVDEIFTSELHIYVPFSS